MRSRPARLRSASALLFIICPPLVILPLRQRLVAAQAFLNVLVVMDLSQHVGIILLQLRKLRRHGSLPLPQKHQNIVKMRRLVRFIRKKLPELGDRHPCVFKTADGPEAVDMAVRENALTGRRSSDVSKNPLVLILSDGRRRETEHLRQLPDRIFLHFLAPPGIFRFSS